MINVYMLPAGSGDFFVIEYGEQELHYILIDGGDAAGTMSYIQIINYMQKRGQEIDAVIFTHIDDDHIYGALKAFSIIKDMPIIRKIYINTGEAVEKRLGINVDIAKPELDTKEYLYSKTSCHSVRKAMCLKNFLEEKHMDNLLQPCVLMGDCIDIGGAKLKIISPGAKELENYIKMWKKEVGEEIKKKKCTHCKQVERKEKLVCYAAREIAEDGSITNASSIAFIFEYETYKLAFLGDSYPSVCVEGVHKFYQQKVNIDLIKIPHHGSSHNYSQELYDLLQSEYYLLSTNGKSEKPDPVFLGKMFEQNPEAKIYCNSKWFLNYGFTKADEDKYILGENPNLIFLSEKICIVDGLNICGKTL